MIGRATQVVDCRESMGLAKGGGLAQRGTLSEATKPDVIAIAMSPGRRHITKPVCEMTYGLRTGGNSDQRTGFGGRNRSFRRAFLRLREATAPPSG